MTGWSRAPEPIMLCIGRREMGGHLEDAIHVSCTRWQDSEKPSRERHGLIFWGVSPTSRWRLVHGLGREVAGLGRHPHSRSPFSGDAGCNSRLSCHRNLRLMDLQLAISFWNHGLCVSLCFSSLLLPEVLVLDRCKFTGWGSNVRCGMTSSHFSGIAFIPWNRVIFPSITQNHVA